MEKTPLYTIGHGRRPAEEFLQLLQNNGIEYLIDVRSYPYSRYNPQYNQNALRFFLEKNKIRYVHMGDALGGRPKDPICYNNEGRIDYERVSVQDFFIAGIRRLKTAYENGNPVAIMCSESKPQECHRCQLIGRVLFEQNIPVFHIDEKGKLKDQQTVINSMPVKNKRKKLSQIYPFKN